MAVGWNVTCTVQLPPRGQARVHVVAPSGSCAASGPLSVNRVAAVNVSGLRPLFLSVNVRAGVLRPDLLVAERRSLTAVSVASGATDTSRR